MEMVSMQDAMDSYKEKQEAKLGPFGTKAHELLIAGETFPNEGTGDEDL